MTSIIHTIYYLLKNVKKKTKFKLQNNNIKSFISDFYIMKNSYNED